MEKHIFYRPETGVAADVIPYFENGTYYLFYLRDERDVPKYGEGVSWYLLTTTDFVTFREHGMVLAHGSLQQQDLYAFTGCVIKLGRQYYLFYTGHNPYLIAQGKPQEAILRARSTDLIHWEKDTAFALYAPTEIFESNEWRDPFVFFNPDDQFYHMLVMGRSIGKVSGRRGTTVHLVSKDAAKWQLCKLPFYSPNRFNAHECPDFFTLNNRQYLLFSEYSHEKVTRYVLRNEKDEAWFAPGDDKIDATAFYAAKTAGPQNAHYAFGWIPIRADASDDGAWQWGGCLCTHAITARSNGTLCESMPLSVQAAFHTQVWQRTATFCTPHGYESYRLGSLPTLCLVEISVKARQIRELEIIFRANHESEEGVVLRLEFNNSRAVIDRRPRDPSRAFEPGLERRLPAMESDEPYRIQLLLDGTAGCAYFHRETSLCFRCYAHAGEEILIGTTDTQGQVAVQVKGMA